jgi:hypothetical protein
MAKVELRSSNKMNRGTGILPVNHGQVRHATTKELILLEFLNPFVEQSMLSAIINHK